MKTLDRSSEATFRVYRLEDQSYAIELSIPDTFPTTVKNFSTEEAATAWVESYKTALEAARARGGTMRRGRGRSPGPSSSSSSTS